MQAESRAADGRLIARAETSTSADGKQVVQDIDQGGNGFSHRWIEDTVHDNGEQVHVVIERDGSAATLSTSTTIVSASRLATTKIVDFDGDGTADLNRQRTLVAADTCAKQRAHTQSFEWTGEEGAL